MKRIVMITTSIIPVPNGYVLCLHICMFGTACAVRNVSIMPSTSNSGCLTLLHYLEKLVNNSGNSLLLNFSSYWFLMLSLFVGTHVCSQLFFFFFFFFFFFLWCLLLFSRSFTALFNLICKADLIALLFVRL